MLGMLGGPKLLQFLPLLNMRLEDLTVTTVKDVLAASGKHVEINDELLAAGVALLAGENIHTVSDMIQSPEALQQLVQFFSRGVGLRLQTDGSAEEPSVINHEADTPRLYTGPPGWRFKE